MIPMLKKVLLIEDNPDHAYITKKILNDEDSDYQLEWVGDGDKGLRQIMANDYDVVVCDFSLPGLNALEILKSMNVNNKEVPLIVTTAAGSEKVAPIGV